jgi:hypothetical protein
MIVAETAEVAVSLYICLRGTVHGHDREVDIYTLFNKFCCL